MLKTTRSFLLPLCPHLIRYAVRVFNSGPGVFLVWGQRRETFHSKPGTSRPSLPERRQLPSLSQVQEHSLPRGKKERLYPQTKN